MKVSILCTDPKHPVNHHVELWSASQPEDVLVEIRRDYRELKGGDFLFLISCHQIIKKSVRDMYRHTLVIHASDLPRGRGMSPLVWSILEGSDEITVSLLNAEDEIDSGDIWRQETLHVEPTELYDEIHGQLFEAEVRLMTWAIANCDYAKPFRQSGEPTYYRKRVPADSEFDPHRPLAEAFNLLRIADPDRYPAFFRLHGQRFSVRIEKF